jgi:hypothetical protein
MNKWRAQRFQLDAEAIYNFTYELLTSVVVPIEETPTERPKESLKR